MSDTARILKSIPFPLFCTVHKSIPQPPVYPVLNIATDANISLQGMFYILAGALIP